jgi:hypothetical protein
MLGRFAYNAVGTERMTGIERMMPISKTSKTREFRCTYFVPS